MSFLAAARLFGTCKKNTLKTAQIYGASAYLKGISVIRDFFIYQIGILTCVMFLVFGLMLMEAAVLFYLPVEPSERLILAFALGALHCLTGLLLLGYFSSSKRWLRVALKHNAWVEDVIDEENQKSHKQKKEFL